MVLASRAAAGRSLDRGIIAAPEKIVFPSVQSPIETAASFSLPPSAKLGVGRLGEQNLPG